MARVELLVLRARLVESGTEAIDAWDRALAIAPHHAAALRGVEGELESRAQREDVAAREAYAEHLARMADAYASDAKLAAWLHVERANVLEHGLKKIDAARAALERALELDGQCRTRARRERAIRCGARRSFRARGVARRRSAPRKEPGTRGAFGLDAACLADFRLGDSTRAMICWIAPLRVHRRRRSIGAFFKSSFDCEKSRATRPRSCA